MAGVISDRVEQKTQSPKLMMLFLSFAALTALSIASFFIGPVSIPFATVMEILIRQIPVLGGIQHFSIRPVYFEIVFYIREPEILGGVVVGASLGMGGAVVQSIFKNPITEPYVIGLSSGAALGAVGAIVFGITIFGPYSVQMLAFCFALLTVFLVYALSHRHGRVPATYLLLMGVSISFFTSSVVALMIYSNIELQSSAFFWLLGSLQGITWQELLPVVFTVLPAMFIMSLYSRELNALQLGGAYAHSVGIRVERTKRMLIALVALSVSASVSISGLIGFVGLIMPHMSRLLYGGSNRYVLPSSAILGAIFLVLADDIARMAIPGKVIPIGIITGMIGVPFFIYMLGKLSSGAYEN
ncbi:MAG: iron chelate uptake ABC transporter family permease subunit [Thermoplasmata archaeon]|nr:iron chelate uptake ABC transporter family permease subunit [Candidatus Sysuiplasma acidicola]